jgi:hypothetical protein
VEEITEGFAAARGLALPSQLRRMLKTQGRDLHGEFVRLLPKPPEPVSIQRWNARRFGLMALALVGVLLIVAMITDSTNNDIAVATPVRNIDRLQCDQLEPLWLEAQAVPSATHVPCLATMPPGWDPPALRANSGRATITLDHDRAGAGVVVITLTRACATTGAEVVATPAEGVTRAERLDQLDGRRFAATWFDTFEGGCITYRLASRDDPEGRFATELPSMIGLASRASLDQALAERSDGRLHLDPRR